MASKQDSAMEANESPDHSDFELYTGKDDPRNYDLTDDEIATRGSDLQEAAKTLRAMYRDGAPFFTKDAIRKLVRQIDNSNSGIEHGKESREGRPRYFSIEGLDGKTVEIENETGTTQRWDTNLERVMYV